MIDFTQLGLNTFQKQINPRDIFMGLTNKTEKYQYPRDVQGEVWKQWFEQRNNRDTIIKMNTGSGKTVVALMILQSCLNEGIGPAMYIVPDKYLVEQVISQAKELGIKVIDSETDLDYSRKRAILVTTIQKLVNGKSVFGLREENNYNIGSVIIDDMHACIGNIQEQFSIIENLEDRESIVKQFLKEVIGLENREMIPDLFTAERVLNLTPGFLQDYGKVQLIKENNPSFNKTFDVIASSMEMTNTHSKSR